MRSWKFAAAAGVVAVGAALAAGAPAAEAKGDLILRRFLIGQLEPNTEKFIATGAGGTTNVFRDNALMFVFSAPVYKASEVGTTGRLPGGNFNTSTIKIGVPSGPSLFIDAEGTFYAYVVKRFDAGSGQFVPQRIYRNRVIFDPTSRREAQNSQNPYGFVDNSLYTVTVAGIDTGATKVVRTVKDRPNLVTYVTSFRTTDKYLQDYRQPSIVKVEAVDAPGVPLDGRTNVDSRADIVAYFSEPMLPATFDADSSFRVFNASSGKPVTGSIRPSPDGLYFTYRPAFGYGRGPSNVQVTLTTALEDRSNNAVDKGITVNFVSEFDPFAPGFLEIPEDFVTKTYEDTTFPLASTDNGRAYWNGLGSVQSPGIPGSLQASYGQGQREINFGSVGGWVSPPWYSTYSHTQMLYTAGHMGKTARTVSGFAWHMSSTAGLTLGTFSGVTVKMGHNTSGAVNTNFTSSFSDTPVTLMNAGSYQVTTALNNNGWVTGPAYSGTWGYNGVDNLVLDINVANSGGPYNRIAFGPSGATGLDFFYFYGGGGPYYYSSNNAEMRFFYLVDKSEAQSRWYDTGQINPQYLDPIVGSVVPPGTSVSITYQGARSELADPTQPDLNTATAWTNDPLQNLAGFRFIRFHVDFQSNLSSNTRPQVDIINMSYIFF
jgi:hypothetical protein